MNRSAIRVQHLSQGYRRNLVLDDVSLEMPCGQTFALLGRNGSGKTTLIRTLLGLMPPRSGTVDVLGLNPAQQPLEIRSRIGYLAEDQNIRLGLALALAHRPELVILDDPALGLDPISRKQFNRDVVEHLQSEGATVFYSSHLLYEVEAVA